MARKLQRSAAQVAPSPGPAPGPRAAEPRAGGEKRRRGGRVSTQTVTEFTIQLATLSESGIPIVKALTILEGQTRPGPFKTVLSDLVEDVSAGTPLSDAMAKHPRVFDRLYTSMVRA